MTEDLLSVTRSEVLPLPGVSVVSTGHESVFVTVCGEVDTFGTPVLDAALDVVWGDDTRDLVIDLTERHIPQCLGLHALVRARDRAAQRAVHLSLWTRSRLVEWLLEFVGASDVTVARARSEGSDGEVRRGGGVVPARKDAALPDVDLPGRSRGDLSIADDPALRTVRVGAAWCSADSLQSTLESVCATACATIPGTEGAGVVLVGSDHRAGSRAATDGGRRLSTWWRRACACPRGENGIRTLPGSTAWWWSTISASTDAGRSLRGGPRSSRCGACSV